MVFETIIKQYTEKPLKATPRQLEEIDTQLKELDEQKFGIELFPKRLILKQKALYAYAKISPLFLKIHNEKEWGEHFNGEEYGYRKTVSVPAFSIYTLHDPIMEINFGKIGDYYRFRIKKPENLPEVLKKQLAISCEIFRDEKILSSIDSVGDYFRIDDDGYYRGGWLYGLEGKIRKKYKSIGKVEIGSTFTGIIPTKTRKNIKDAEKIFSDNIFLIAETKPEQWATEYKQRFVKELLLIGVIDDDCFHINTFNPIPLDNYVGNELLNPKTIS